jgi:hypothetical protein
LGNEEGPPALGELGVRNRPLLLPESVSIELTDRIQAGYGGNVSHVGHDEVVGLLALILVANRTRIAGQSGYVFSRHVLRWRRGCEGLRLLSQNQPRNGRHLRPQSDQRVTYSRPRQN